MIEKHEITSREQWLEMRRQDVTASQVGALFGIHRYVTAAGLYAEKTGKLVEDDRQTGPMSRGVKLEPFVASEVQRLRPDLRITKETAYYRDPKTRIAGTPDYRIVRISDGAIGKLEVKTVGMRDFIAIWKNGDKDADPMPEAWQILQNLTYQFLEPEASFGMVAVLPVGDWAPMNVEMIDIPRRDDMWEEICSRVRGFWRRVEDGAPPDFDYDRDGEVIRKLYGSAIEGKKIDLTRDNEIGGLLDTREAMKDLIKASEKTLKHAENEIRAKLGDAEEAIVTGWYLTNKNQHREGYAVKPVDFRSLHSKKIAKKVIHGEKVT